MLMQMEKRLKRQGDTNNSHPTTFEEKNESHAYIHDKEVLRNNTTEKMVISGFKSVDDNEYEASLHPLYVNKVQISLVFRRLL